MTTSIALALAAIGSPCGAWSADSEFTQDNAQVRVSGDWDFGDRAIDAAVSTVAATVRATAVDAQGGVWAATDQGLVRLMDGDELWFREDGSKLLSDDVRDVATGPDGMVYAATARGLSITDGHGHWLTQRGADGLPIEDLTCLSIGDDGTVWLGTPEGACRLREGVYSYFAGRRWLPDNRVLDIRVDEDGAAHIRTETGIAEITPEPMTLARKAEIFLDRLRARHVREGYVTDCALWPSGDISTPIHIASDNDGLWTALYIAAESYRYAVTGAKDARRHAQESMRALVRLEELTPIDGFPARAAVRKDEEVIKSEGEWHDCADGEWEWKGDTSSDELDGHYFAYAIYYDLVADDDEKDVLRAAISRITDHLLDNNYCLIDLDGQPTRWAVFGPSFLNDDPEWAVERGLNSLSILSHLKVAHHMTDDPRYEQAYRDLIERHGYLLNSVNQKVLLPFENNHSDDELAFVCYQPLMQYERDPGIRALLLASIERSWRIERAERNPWFNFIYGEATGKPCDVEDSIKTLREIPMDLINWRMTNSHRADLAVDRTPGRFREPQAKTVLPYSERAMFRWNGNPYALDAGGDGSSEDDGAFFLLPYWMGRYVGCIR